MSGVGNELDHASGLLRLKNSFRRFRIIEYRSDAKFWFVEAELLSTEATKIPVP